MFYLFAGDSRVTICGRSENQIVKNWSVGCDSYAAAYHNGNFKFVPVLISSTKRTFQ